MTALRPLLTGLALLSPVPGAAVADAPFSNELFFGTSGSAIYDYPTRSPGGGERGEFVAYAADSGTRLWSAQTGSAIHAAPAGFAVHGRQHIVVPIGTAGGLQYRYPEMHAAERAGPGTSAGFLDRRRRSATARLAHAACPAGTAAARRDGGRE